MVTRVIAEPEAGAARRELARGGAMSFVGAAVSAVLGMVLIVVLGRMLGAAGAGVVLQAVAVFTIALGVARLGMDSTALWLLPRLRDDDPTLVPRATWFLVLVSGIAGVVCAALMLATASYIETLTSYSGVAPALRAIAPYLPAGAMLLTTLAATRALGRVTAYVWIGNIALPAIRPVAVFAAVALGAGLTGAAVAWALPLAPVLFLAFAVLFAHTRRYGPGEVLNFHRSRIARRAMHYALPRVISAVLEQLLLWAAVLGVGIMVNDEAAGIYGAASRFIAAGLIIDVALRVVVAPMFSRIQNRGDHGELNSVYRTATRWLVLFSTPVFILLAVFAPLALAIIGDEFVSGEPVLQIMCAGGLATLFAGNVHSVLLMSGRSGLAAINKAIVVVLLVVLLIVLTPMWGIIGAAYAWAIACLTDAALAASEVRFILKLHISLTPGIYPFLIGAVCVGIPAVIFRSWLGPSWIAFVAAAAIGTVSFLVWCRIDAERLQLHSFALQLPQGRPPGASSNSQMS